MSNPTTTPERTDPVTDHENTPDATPDENRPDATPVENRPTPTRTPRPDATPDENRPVAPLRTSRTRSTVAPYDTALRRFLDAANSAHDAGVTLEDLLLRVLVAHRGNSLPGRDDYRLARKLSALVDEEGSL